MCNLCFLVKLKCNVFFFFKDFNPHVSRYHNMFMKCVLCTKTVFIDIHTMPVRKAGEMGREEAGEKGLPSPLSHRNIPTFSNDY